MDLNGINADFRRPPCGSGKGIADPLHAFAIERSWRHVVRVEGNGGRCLGLPSVRIGRRELTAASPGNLGRGFAAGMCQLHGDWHIRPFPDAFERTGHRGFGGVIIKADIGKGDASFGNDSGCLNGQKCGTGKRQLSEMDQMPVRHAAVDGRVLAHGRDHDTVGEFKTAHGERRKQDGLGHGVPRS